MRDDEQIERFDIIDISMEDMDDQIKDLKTEINRLTFYLKDVDHQKEAVESNLDNMLLEAFRQSDKTRQQYERLLIQAANGEIRLEYKVTPAKRELNVTLL